MPIKAVQTDNGLEHYKHFEEYLKKSSIKHYWNRPATPKSNCYIERFNRTLQEECVNHVLHKINSSTLSELNEILEEYLKFYNGIRPHRSLQNFTPDSEYNKLITFSQM
jgi:transposase InsO family protein